MFIKTHDTLHFVLFNDIIVKRVIEIHVKPSHNVQDMNIVVARALFLILWELVWVSPSAASPLIGGSSGDASPHTTEAVLRGSAVIG
ncbi:MAG: hypothetical protein DRJ47_01230 [Thermoprotei archaeon]|nr:MAG: hypothetical protein DRJ47_01230 [Thermoprotei archaeon]